jgi:surface antigen
LSRLFEKASRGDLTISTTTAQTARGVKSHLPFAKSALPTGIITDRLSKKLNKKSTRRRLIRYSLIGGNVAILVAVLSFIAISPKSSTTSGATKPSLANSALAATDSNVTSPLDQLSAADIAVNVARMGQLPEATAVTNQADSVNADLAIAPVGDSIASKPQVVSTALNSRSDIKRYATAAGDTVSSVATKFGVTSDSIRWSNSLSLSTTTIAANTKLVIPPVNGIVYTVASGDTPDSLATKFKASKDRIVAANDAEITGLKAGEQVLIPDGSQQAAVAVIPSSSASSSYGGGGFAWGATAIYGSNGYDYGYCTWYVANRRAEIGKPVPSNLGNAYSWYRAAAAAGLPTGFTPQVGAVMVNEGGNHVAVVEQVNDDGSFWISEMNSHGQVSMTNPAGTGGWGVRDYKVEPGPGNFKFIY